MVCLTWDSFSSSITSSRICFTLSMLSIRSFISSSSKLLAISFKDSILSAASSVILSITSWILSSLTSGFFLITSSSSAICIPFSAAAIAASASAIFCAETFSNSSIYIDCKWMNGCLKKSISAAVDDNFLTTDLSCSCWYLITTSLSHI